MFDQIVTAAAGGLIKGLFGGSSSGSASSQAQQRLQAEQLKIDYANMRRAMSYGAIELSKDRYFANPERTRGESTSSQLNVAGLYSPDRFKNTAAQLALQLNKKGLDPSKVVDVPSSITKDDLTTKDYKTFRV